MLVVSDAQIALGELAVLVSRRLNDEVVPAPFSRLAARHLAQVRAKVGTLEHAGTGAGRADTEPEGRDRSGVRGDS